METFKVNDEVLIEDKLGIIHLCYGIIKAIHKEGHTIEVHTDSPKGVWLLKPEQLTKDLSGESLYVNSPLEDLEKD